MTSHRLPALDGLRAASILLVLAGHLLPLGPKTWQLNATATVAGMALFFALSGFLIVRFLAEGMALSDFAVRRLARIVPLAWTAMLALWLWNGGDLLANLLFIANLPPARLMHGGEHLWSLCVEVQFYAAAGLLCLWPRRTALRLIPVLALTVTALRVIEGQTVSIVTWHRLDEILAGGTIALAFCGALGEPAGAWLKRVPMWVAVLALLACSHPESGVLLYLRPYSGALVLGSVIFNLDRYSERLLVNRPAAYIAEISYALYVVHGAVMVTWLGNGSSSTVKYLKRPLLFALTFGLAHLSTFCLERPITRLVRRPRRSLTGAP
jgi:peptidoglycan/LPS O-acetylase OafA/YrhL